MTILQDAAAIHAALGLQESVKGALPIAQAAAELMGAQFAHGTPLPVMLSELTKMIGAYICRRVDRTRGRGCCREGVLLEAHRSLRPPGQFALIGFLNGMFS